MTAVHINAKIIRNRWDSYHSILESLKLKFDILLFINGGSTENGQFPQFEHNKPVGLSRSNGRRGITIYLKTGANYIVLGEVSRVYSNTEFLVVNAEIFVVALAYRPPTGSKSIFLEFLHVLLCFLNRLFLRLLNMRNFNINRSAFDTYAKHFHDISDSNGCKNVITLQRRITVESDKFIDICITNPDTAERNTCRRCQ